MTPVGKDTFFFRVSMQINEHGYSFVVVEDISFDSMDLTSTVRPTSFPSPIEVIPCNVATGISKNDSIRIDHRDDLNDVVLEKFIYDMIFLFFFRIIDKQGSKSIEDAFDYMGSCSFSWMAPSDDKYDFLLGRLLAIIFFG